MSVLAAIGAVLAAYRLAHLIARERGPFDVLAAFRSWVLQGVGLDEGHWLYAGVTCIACLSYWLSLGVLALLLYGGAVSSLLVGWWAIAGGVLVLMQLIDAAGKHP